MRNLYSTPLVALSILFISCASVGPKYSQMAISESHPAQGHARIYFLREARVTFSARHAPIKIDEQEVGALRNGAFFFIDVSPGNHRMSIKNWDAGMFSIEGTVEADKTYYIKVIPRKEFLAAFLPLAVISIPALMIGSQVLENKGMFALVPIVYPVRTIRAK